MSEEKMNGGIMYSISKILIARFVRNGLITEEEYQKIDKLNAEKFLKVSG